MLTLYTNCVGNFYYYNPKMTADYCNYPVQVHVCTPEELASKDIKAMKGMGKFPFLATEDGTIIRESVAISQYIARKAQQMAFVGLNAFEEAQVEQWTSLAMGVLAPNVKVVEDHMWGWKVNPTGCKESENTLKGFMKQLNTSLDGKSWLVGERMTLADIVVFNNLITAFYFTFDAGFLKAMPHAAAWFGKMAKLPIVARTAGYFKLQGGAPAKP